MKNFMKSVKRLFSSNTVKMNSVVNSRFNPSNLGLDKNFSLIKFSSLKG